MGKSKHKYKVYNGKVIKDMLENSRLFIFVIIFSVGIIVGAASIKNNGEMIEKIKYLISSFALKRAGQGMLEIFINSFLVNIVFVILSVFFAFSLIGYPLIMFLPFIRGAAIGAISGYLYIEYKFTGLGYSLLMIYPSAVLCMVALMIIFNDSCEYSHNAYQKAISGRGHFEKDETKLFLIRQIFFTAVVAVSSFVDALSVKLFSGFFLF